MKLMRLKIFGVILVSVIMGSGCVIKNDLHSIMEQYRKVNISACVNEVCIPIPGLSGTGLLCSGADSSNFSSSSILPNGMSKEIPVTYVCKATSHQMANSKRGTANARAMLVLEVEPSTICDDKTGSDLQHIVGYHIVIYYANQKECCK